MIKENHQKQEIIPARYPQLALITWNRNKNIPISGDEALALYESNWRFVDMDAMTPEERELLEALIQNYGKGVLHV